MAGVPMVVAQHYMELLAEEGYRPKVESIDHALAVVSFKSEGEVFLLFVHEDDENFLHVGSWYDLNGLDPSDAVQLANDLNEDLKVIKVTIGVKDRSARFHLETFLDAIPVSTDPIDRAVSVLREAAQRFFQPVRSPDQLDA